MTEIIDGDFKEIIANNKLTMIEFWATWCGPCRALSSFIDKLSDEYGDKLFIAKANVEECEDTTNSLNVQNLPCVVFFKDGIEVSRVVGNNQAKIKETINSLVG